VLSYPGTGLELAAVSSPRLSVLVIAGELARRRPFEATVLTIKVSDLTHYTEVLRAGGAIELDPIQKDAGRAEDALPARGRDDCRICRA
jgi:hypothetical protein